MATPEQECRPSSVGFAFIHGGAHHGGCWSDTIAAITGLDATVRCLAVDLPGRRSVPGDLGTLTVDECVGSITEQITTWSTAENVDKVVLVGHSLAGITMPGVAQSLDPNSLDQIIFVACVVPQPGSGALDTLPAGLRAMTRRVIGRSPIMSHIPSVMLRLFFSNAATPAQRKTIKDNICAESAALITGASQGVLPAGVTKSWVISQRDRALPPRMQRRFISAIGGVDHVRSLDAGHELMLTEPTRLAATLLELASKPAS